MGDLLESFLGRARVRPKCVGKTYVGLWGQSTVSMSNHRRFVGPGCYKRCHDRIMLVRIVVGEEVISIVNAYGPQVGLDEQVKFDFWDNLGDLM